MLVGLVIFAILTVNTANFRRAVIYSAVFSLILSLSFLYYQAPDVAIAEAVIGSALASVLYLVALRKQDRMTVCLLGAACQENGQEQDLVGLTQEAERLLQMMRDHFRAKKVTLHVIRSDEPLEALLARQHHDLLLCQADHRLTLYGRPADYRLDEIERLTASGLQGTPDVQFIRCEEGGVCDA